MKPERKEGWQCWVDIYEDHVIKTPKKRDEMEKRILPYLKFIGKEEKLQSEIERVLKDLEQSLKILKKSNIPPKFLGFPEFREDGKIKQKKGKLLKEELGRLVEKNQKDQAKKLIDKILEFMIELWKYGIHETTFKFYSNFGLIEDKIILLDFLEITDKKEIVEKQIKKKKWDKPQRLKNNPLKEFFLYFNEQAEKILTIKNLNKYWKTK